MKKLFFGTILLVLGVIGKFILIILSAKELVNLNGIQGFNGYLLLYGFRSHNDFFTKLIIFGILLCIYSCFLERLIKLYLGKCIEKTLYYVNGEKPN